jgi:diguanylate cyclase (GGDEF)-like protein
VSDWLDNIQVLGLLVQASGALLIAGFSFASWRSAAHPALLRWTLAWLLLAAALLSLLVGMAMPSLALTWVAWLADSGYLLAEYGFLYFLVTGLRSLETEHADLHPAALLVPAALLAGLLPWLCGFEFQRLFLVQAALLAGGFGWALASLPQPEPGRETGVGLRTVQASLLLLFGIFVHYVPIFGLVVAGRMDLPLDYLKLTSIAHLVAEFALGYAGAMAVLENSNRSLRLHNSDLRRDGERLRKLSEIDPLTGTLNRRAFATILGERRDAGLDGGGSIALIDVDDMKRVNAHGGHPLGDAALRALAICTAVLARDGDLVVRWGGDEFLLVAFGAAPDELQRVLEPLPAQLLSRKTLVDAPPGWLGASYGVAGFDRLDEVDQAISDADAAMFAHKSLRKPAPIESSGGDLAAPSEWAR